MINTSIDWELVYSQYQECGISVIDNFIDTTCINFLRDFALTMHYRDTLYDGYSALNFTRTGILPYMLECLVDECERSVTILKDKKFTRGWFLTYDSTSNGVNVHVDPYSDITVNIWVTPDNCMAAGKGFNGLDIWELEPMANWDYDTSNGDYQKCLEYIKDKQAKMTSVEYKFNRTVLFNSNYFHRSQPVKCRDGDDNRKINYALLFKSDLQQGS